MRKVAGIVVVLLLLGVGALVAQETTGRIVGTVTDSSGAVIPNASIAITNHDTGAVRTVVSNADGFYIAPQVGAGTYTVEATASGFRPAQVNDVVVTVGSDSHIDLKVDVGSVSQTVTVTEAAPLIDTSTSSVGSTVDEQRVADLPLNGRNWTDLTLLQPGISQYQASNVASGNNAVTLAGYNGLIYSSNGGQIRSNLYTLDGANIMNLTGFNNTSVSNTSLGVDGIKEYKVVTSMFSAEYGLTMGSQTTIVSKSGSNQFHGDAYDYLRNSSLDARNYFDATDTTNFNGFGTDKSLPFPGKRLPPFRRNNFGGSFGGPIKKDKTFFYGVFEGIRQQLGVSTVNQDLPAACFVNSAGVTQAQVPAMIKNVNSLGTCNTAAGAPAVITVNPVILPFAQLFPFPNVVGNPSFNYAPRYIQPTSEEYGQMRIDQIFSDKDTFFSRYTQDVSDEIVLPTYPHFINPLHSSGQFGTLAESHVFSPTLLNSFRFSYSRSIDHVIPTVDPDSLVQPDVVLTPGAKIPAITPFSGGSVIGDSQAESAFDQDIFTWSDDVFWTKGKHALKFGTLMNHYLQYVEQNSPNGTSVFGTVGNFLNGVYSQVQLLTPGSFDHLQFRYNTFGFYAQDDYRMNSRLTWNIGLRYEFATVPHERNPELASTVRFPLFDTTGTPGPLFTNNTTHNFSPRIGFAWDPFGKSRTVIKGGSGIYYDIGTNYGGLEANASQANPPITNTVVLNNTLAVPVIPYHVPFTVSVNQPQAPRTVQFDLQQPTLLQYNLQVEQQLPWGMAMTVGYVGSRGWHLMQTKEGDPPVAVGTDAEGLPIYGCWNSTRTATASLTPVGACPAGFTNSGPRLNPAFSEVWRSAASGDSYFNSLQAQVLKRISQGLQFQLAYTWAHSIDDGTGIATRDGGTGTIQTPFYLTKTQPLTQRFDRGPSIFDIRNNIRANMIYHAPNLKSNGIVSKVANGWWFSSIVSAQSGYPFTVNLGSDRELAAGNVSERPSLDPSFNASTVITGNPVHWFNPTMFDLQPAGTLGNEPRGFLRGPGFYNVDFSAVKDTKLGLLGEAGMVEFRAEVFNILNHTNFSLPNNTIWSAGSPATVTAGQIGVTPGVNPTGTAGTITSTANFSRQIQFAIKLIF
jgi:Carboxypeptidase regulatory-like domain/TonB dependent receptor